MSASYDVDTLVPTASQDFATHTLGPPFAGWIAQTFFTGVLTTWAFQYVRSEAHQNDRRATKVLLYAVLLLAWAQEVVTITLVMHYGTYQKRDSTTLYAQTAMDCLSTLFVGEFTATADDAPIILTYPVQSKASRERSSSSTWLTGSRRSYRAGRSAGSTWA